MSLSVKSAHNHQNMASGKEINSFQLAAYIE